jgi:hypothetical protein
MQFNAGLTGDAATLAREHAAVLARLPATVQAFVLVELQKWPTLFAPEQRYQRALLEHLARFSSAELQQIINGIVKIEADAGCDKIARGDPGRFQDEAQALLRKRRLVAAWRKEVDGLFQQVDPAIEAALYPAGAPRRLVVQIYGSGIAVQRGKLWSRFKSTGVRVPLDLRANATPGEFLQALFGNRNSGSTDPAFFAAARDAAGLGPSDVWLLESHDALHGLWDEGSPPAPVTGLSYDRLRAYRTELTRALYSKILSGVESPQAFAAYARSLRIAPGSGLAGGSSEVLQAFIRDVLLTGNGTLVVNNTFLEWAAVQALRRAQPRILVTRFGVRDKFQPFSSMLLFSQPRASDQRPVVQDPAGSFVDVEQLSYYVWLNAEKSAAYRKKTLYLFLAEGVDQMLAVRSDAAAAPAAALPPATLSDVCATMAAWLGIGMPEQSGRVIAPLVG